MAGERGERKIGSVRTIETYLHQSLSEVECVGAHNEEDVIFFGETQFLFEGVCLRVCVCVYVCV